MMHIIWRIANQEETSASVVLPKYITPEVKAKYNIPENAEAFSVGASSAIYENSLGQIVAFTDINACKSSYKSVGKDSDILPELFDLDEITFEMGKYKIKYCVIVMEKLRPLTGVEEIKCEDAEFDYFKWLENNSSFEGDSLESINEYVGQAEDFGNLILIEKAYFTLRRKMFEQNIKHADLIDEDRDFYNFQNIAWGKNNELKLIDWESIFVPEYWT